jgi:hypothetical protein
MIANRQLRNRAVKVLALLWIVASVLTWLSMDRAAAAVTDRTVEALAGEIARGLEGADLSAFSAASGYSQPTIAIKSFTEAVGPIDAAEANYINDRLLIALQRQSRGRFRFVARDAVGDLIADIDATTEPSAARDERLRDLQANLRADILIRGTLRQTTRGSVLTYQAVASETGALFVSTTPVVISTPARIPAPAHVIQDRPSHGVGSRRAVVRLGLRPRPHRRRSDRSDPRGAARLPARFRAAGERPHDLGGGRKHAPGHKVRS